MWKTLCYQFIVPTGLGAIDSTPPSGGGTIDLAI